LADGSQDRASGGADGLFSGAADTICRSASLPQNADGFITGSSSILLQVSLLSG